MRREAIALHVRSNRASSPPTQNICIRLTAPYPAESGLPAGSRAADWQAHRQLAEATVHQCGPIGTRAGHTEFLELICQDEIKVRQQWLMARRTNAADFRGLKILEDFDWSINPAIHRKDIFDLTTGNFICQANDVLFLGPSGVGTTHLASAVGYEAIKMNFQVLYRSISDLVRDFIKDEAFKTAGRNPVSLPPRSF